MHLKPISYELRRDLYNRRHPLKKRLRKRKKLRRQKRKKNADKSLLPKSYRNISPDSPSKNDFLWKRTEEESASPTLPAAFRTFCHSSCSEDSDSASDHSNTNSLGSPNPYLTTFILSSFATKRRKTRYCVYLLTTPVLISVVDIHIYKTLLFHPLNCAVFSG